MKRMILACMLCLLIAVSACAQEELRWLSPTIGGNDAMMIVDNGSDWSVRLNLRAEPRKGSEIKGRVYTGTRVELYEDNGEWCFVGLLFGSGNVLTGHVMKEYLTAPRDGFEALCPLAAAKTETEIVTNIQTPVTTLRPGDKAYVLAVCGDEYYVMVPGVGQGYAPADAFEPLEEPGKEERIRYGVLTVPSGGVKFEDVTGREVTICGGARLEDCWQLPGAAEWYVTFGAGIQRSPRVKGVIPQGKLTKSWIPFEGEVYALGRSFIARVGTADGQPILRRTDQNGDIYWAQGDVPKEAVLLDPDICRIECEPQELLSHAVVDNIFDYVVRHSVLDERTSGESVTKVLAERCTLRTALELNPCTGKLERIHAWLEDRDGSYVTGGDLDPRTGTITRWGCDA